MEQQFDQVFSSKVKTAFEGLNLEYNSNHWKDLKARKKDSGKRFLVIVAVAASSLFATNLNVNAILYNVKPVYNPIEHSQITESKESHSNKLNTIKSSKTNAKVVCKTIEKSNDNLLPKLNLFQKKESKVRRSLFTKKKGQFDIALSLFDQSLNEKQWKFNMPNLNDSKKMIAFQLTQGTGRYNTYQDVMIQGIQYVNNSHQSGSNIQMPLELDLTTLQVASSQSSLGGADLSNKFITLSSDQLDVNITSFENGDNSSTVLVYSKQRYSRINLLKTVNLNMKIELTNKVSVEPSLTLPLTTIGNRRYKSYINYGIGFRLKFISQKVTSN